MNKKDISDKFDEVLKGYDDSHDGWQEAVERTAFLLDIAVSRVEKAIQ
jgi:hypothetical protein